MKLFISVTIGSFGFTKVEKNPTHITEIDACFAEKCGYIDVANKLKKIRTQNEN